MGEDYAQSIEDEEKVYPAKESKYSQSENVFLTFRGNRSYELHVGREVHRFEGRQKKELPSSVLEHKDFTENIKKLFIIQEGN